jgi:hypothetical protein
VRSTTRTHRAPARRWRLTVLAVLAIGGVMLLTNCGGGGDNAGAANSNAATTTTNEPGTAKISSLDVPPTAACNGKTSVTVHVSYATEGAKSVELVVDGAAVPSATATSGALDVPIHCDPLPHTFVIVAKDSNGRSTSLQKLVTTNA